MKKRNFILLVIYVLLSSSCNNSSQKESKDSIKVIDIDFSKIENELSVSEFIESKELLMLNLPDNEFLGRPIQACFCKNDIFILDKLQKGIYHFNRKGAFINKIGKAGQGPEEYSSPNYIMVKDSILYIYDKVLNKINLYSYEGDYIETIKIQEGLRSIALLPDGTFLCFTPDFIYNAPLGLWKMSNSGNFEKTIIKYKEKYPIVYADWSYFYPISSEIVGIACPATNRYLEYDYEHDCVTINLEMKIKQKTAHSFPGIDNNLSVKEPYWVCPIFVCSGKYIFGIWSEYGGRSQGIYSLYNKTTQKMKCYNKLNTSAMGVTYLGAPLVSNLPNSMLTYFPEEDGRTTLCIYNLK